MPGGGTEKKTPERVTSGRKSSMVKEGVKWGRVVNVLIHPIARICLMNPFLPQGKERSQF